MDRAEEIIRKIISGASRESLAPLLLLAGVVLAANVNVLSAGFVWDDSAVILNNPLIKQWNSLPSVFTTTFLQSYYRPLVLLSFAADYAVWGRHPAGYHLVNLALHILNAFLVFFLLKRLSASQIAAFLGALLFSVHPVQKSVAYISDRTGLLAAFFFLCSVLFYLSYRSSEGGSRSWRYYIAALTSCGLAVFSKEEVLALPLILIAIDFFFFPDSLRKRSLVQAALYLPFFFIALMYVWVRTRVVNAPIGLVSAFFIEPARRLATIPFLLVRYLGLLVFPVRLDYDVRIELINSFFEFRALLGICAIAGMLAAIVWLFRRYRPASFGLLWFLVVFLPMSNVIPIFSDLAQKELFAPVHFLYLPSIGIFLCAGIGFERLFCRMQGTNVRIQKRLAQFAMLFIVLLLCLLSLRRNSIWKSDINFFGYLAQLHPDTVSLRPNLANAYLSAGNTEEAIRQFQKAVSLSPDSAEIHNGLGVAYLNAGMIEPAIRELQRSVQLKPTDAEFYANLAVAYSEQGRLSEAVAANEKAIELAPSAAHVRANLGLILLRAGQYERAEEQFRAALSLSPDDIDSRNALNWLANRGRRLSAEGEQGPVPSLRAGGKTAAKGF